MLILVVLTPVQQRRPLLWSLDAGDRPNLLILRLGESSLLSKCSQIPGSQVKTLRINTADSIPLEVNIAYPYEVFNKVVQVNFLSCRMVVW